MLTLTTVPRDVVLEIGEYLEPKTLLELSLTSKRWASVLSRTLLRAKWEDVHVYIHWPVGEWAPPSTCNGAYRCLTLRPILTLSDDYKLITIVAALPDVASTARSCSGVVGLFITFPRFVYRKFGRVAGLFLDIVRSMPKLGALTFEADLRDFFDPDDDPDDPDDLNRYQPMTAGPMNRIVEIAPCTLHTLAFEGLEPIQGAQLARFRNLKVLQLPPTQRLDATLLETLQTHCPCLTVLHVEAVYPLYLEVLVAGTFTAGLLDLLLRLSVLRLPQRHLPPSDVEAIISRALTSAKFEELVLWNCLFDTAYNENTNPNTVFAVQDVLRSPLSPQLSSTPISLTILALTGVPLSLDTYDTLSSGYLPKLISLTFDSGEYQSCGAIRDPHFEGFLYHAPHLTYLMFEERPSAPPTDTRVPLVTIATLASIARYGRALTTCCIQDVTIEATATFDHVVALVDTLPELERLCLGSSERRELRVGREWYDYDLKWMRTALTEIRAAGLEGAEMLAEMEREWAAEMKRKWPELEDEWDSGVDEDGEMSS
ncbi:hypothetical protein HK104_011519 [Borealophlyctis nickersoniae]|nr:hypothetical protein HK104_011519 [Borealophlyctis nickersoniae]